MVSGWRMAVAGLLLGAAASGFAQTPEEHTSLLPARALSLPLRALAAPEFLVDDVERRAELQRWMDEFTEWQEWSERWRGRRQPGWFTGFRERPQKPAPPSWLPARCESVFDDSDPLTQACALLAAWREDGTPTQRIRQVRVAVMTEQEEPPKTTWWEHVHMDVMWPAVQWQSSVYGVVGMHVATEVGGRLQVFTAPGAMLLNLPARNGTRVWKVAANYGIGYRLMNFVFPGGRPAELHVNLAKMWVLSDGSELITGRTIDVVGFSVTFKRR